LVGIGAFGWSWEHVASDFDEHFVLDIGGWEYDHTLRHPQPQREAKAAANDE